LGGVEQKFDKAKNIFVGQVNSVKFTGRKNSLGDKKTIVKFLVKKSWKGEGDEITLYTAHNRMSCSGYWFKEEHKYLVYAYEEKGKLNTYICGGVIPESENELFRYESTALDKIGK
jgi:hypothetical protein